MTRNALAHAAMIVIACAMSVWAFMDDAGQPDVVMVLTCHAGHVQTAGGYPRCDQ